MGHVTNVSRFYNARNKIIFLSVEKLYSTGKRLITRRNMIMTPNTPNEGTAYSLQKDGEYIIYSICSRE
jgi:hypothetical protein